MVVKIVQFDYSRDCCNPWYYWTKMLSDKLILTRKYKMNTIICELSWWWTQNCWHDIMCIINIQSYIVFKWYIGLRVIVNNSTDSQSQITIRLCNPKHVITHWVDAVQINIYELIYSALSALSHYPKTIISHAWGLTPPLTVQQAERLSVSPASPCPDLTLNGYNAPISARCISGATCHINISCSSTPASHKLVR